MMIQQIAKVYNPRNEPPWWNRPLWGEAIALQQPWWNRPLWGQGNLFANLSKPEVPEKAILLHNQQLQQAREIAEKAKALDSQEFSHNQFLLFLRIENDLRKGVGEYQDLAPIAQLLWTLLEVNKLFQVADRLKSSNQKFEQEELYQQLDQLSITLTEQNLTKQEILTTIEENFGELLENLANECEQNLLSSHLLTPSEITSDRFISHILPFLAKYNLPNYSTLKNINDLVDSLSTEYRQDLNALTVLVELNCQLFEQIAPMLPIPEGKNPPKTYGRIIQYIALRNYYQAISHQFQQLIQVLGIWHDYYRRVIEIHQQYSSIQYKQPQKFHLEIPGLELYQKYRRFLLKE